jgi:hypothetical protein
MSAACPKCNDTGMLPNSKHLDCVHCEVATERVALELWADQTGLPTHEDELWQIYKHGKAMALEQAAKIAEETWVEPGDSQCGTCQEAADAIRALKP